jgi:sugar/nucleoside kinase (ribokinase family)
VLKPNRQEAEKLSGRVLNFTSQAEFDQSARLMASDIFVALPQIHGLLMTLDTYGCVYISVDGVYRYFPGVLPDRKVINPSGAGDIVVSTLCLLANEFEIDVALNTAMWLAGYSVTQAGTSTLTKDLISQVQADRKMFRP